MSMGVIRHPIGGYVPIRVKVRERRSDSDNGRLFDANGVRIKRILKPDGTEIDAADIPAFTWVARGEYVAQWDTRGLVNDPGPGDYEVEIRVTVGYDTVAESGIEVPADRIVRLLPQGGP